MDYIKDLIANKKIFFRFMREKYRLFYNSNIFFRDLQYAIISYYLTKDKRLKYSEAEKITEELIKLLENEGELKKMSDNAWKVNFSLDYAVIQTEQQISPK